MKEVFISYKAEEFDEANWVKSTLENNGISCWMAPASIPGGSSYAVEIPNAIRQAKIFVLILSSKSQSSQWVSKEVDLAINEGKIVLPFMLENCTLKDDFNFYLTNVQRYTAYENKAAAIEKMLNEIKAIIGAAEIPHEEDATPPVKEEIKKEEIKPIIPETKFVAPQSKPKTDAMSVISLIFGIFAMCFLGACLFPNFLAVIFGIFSMKNISKKQLSGKGMAIAGLILGIVSTLIGLIIMLIM